MRNLALVPLSLTRAGWRENLVIVATAWAVPFLVHLVPFEGPRPLGVYLLPSTWTVFVAVYLYGLRSGLLAALVLPGVNFVVTGLPAASQIALTTVELCAYATVVALLTARWPSFSPGAALAWLPAKAAAIALQWAVPAFAYQRNPLEHFFGSVRNGLTGLAVLIAINAVLVALVPKDRDWDAE